MGQEPGKPLDYRSTGAPSRSRSTAERIALSVARAFTQSVFTLLALILLVSGFIWMGAHVGHSFWWMFVGLVLLLLAFAGAGRGMEQILKRMK